MAIEHPFQAYFESFGRPSPAHAKSVNLPAYQALCETLSVPLEHGGRCLLLRAPRAGYGKTHLLSRVRQHFGPSHEFIPLQAGAGSRIDAASVTDDALRWLTLLVPAAGALCGLDWVVRRLFSLALLPLVRSGEVPCLDREATLTSLTDRPLETFDFHHPAALSAHWTRDNFGVLGPRLSLELAQLTGCPPRAVGFWVDAMFRFAVTPIDHPGRVDTLFQTALSECCGEGAALERLATLLTLVGLLTRVVLVADDLEGFSADPAAALRLAWFLGSLRQSAERLDLIVSLNRDVWESAFAPRLSGGLAERLAEVIVELEPLTHTDQVALLESHAPGMGARMLRSLGPDPIDRFARSLLRAAGAAWLKVARETTPAASTDPISTPPPLAMVPTGSALEPAARPAIPPVAGPSAATTPVTTGLTEEPPLLHAPAPVPEPPPAHPATPPPVVQAPVRLPEPAPQFATNQPSEPPPVRLTETRPPLWAAAPRPPRPPEPASAHPTEPPPIVSPPEPPPAAQPEPPSEPARPIVVEPATAPPSWVRPAVSAPVAAESIAPALPAELTPPAEPPAAAATPAAEPPATIDADAVDASRVDALLRQFRERYGRPDPE